MSLPLLAYPLSSQNSRVAPPGGASLAAQQFLQDAGGSYSQGSGVDLLIEKAYKQVFFHAMRCDRIEHLESQLRNGMIPVRDFQDASKKDITNAIQTIEWWIKLLAGC